MDDDEKKLIVQLQIQIQAMSLLVNEALSVALSYDASPDNAASLARQDLMSIANAAVETAGEGETDDTRKKFRRWFCEQVRTTVSEKMDAVEKRVSLLRQKRTTH